MLKLSNVNQPSNKKWKFIADIALYSLLPIIPIVASMPISDNAQKWIIVAINFLVIGFKAVSKFTSEDGTE
jgi:hypothetical protein